MSWRSFWWGIGALLGGFVASVALAEPLLEAAAIGNLAEVRQRLEQGADVNVMDEDKFRPLHWAAFGGHTEMVQLLVDKGAEIDVKNDDGLTPLHTAVLAGHTDVVRRFLELGADAKITTRDGNTARDMAVIRGLKSLVKVFDEQHTLVRHQPSAAPMPVRAVAAPPAKRRSPAVAPPNPLPDAAPPAADDSKAAPVGQFVIQLAALRSKPAAEQTWMRYQKSFPALLGDSPLLLQRVELANQGTFYRIRTGPFPSRDSAEALCQRLKSKQQDCVVVVN